MANVDTGGSDSGKHGKKRAKKGNIHLDMTPMVDLAFLLITFFMLATTLSKPKTTELIYPKELEEEEKDKVTKVADELAITLLVGEEDEHLFYYTGMFKPDTTVLMQTDFSKDGLRKTLFDKNKRINDQVSKLRELHSSKQITDSLYQEQYSDIVGDSLAPFVIIKTIDKTKWRNVINAMDELNITNVKKRAIQDMGDSEAIALRQKIAELGL